MARISEKREHLSALQGYVRTIHVARLTGVNRNAVFMWPIEYKEVSNARFYKWEAVLKHLGSEAVQVLGLPPTAVDALKRARELDEAGAFVIPERDDQCLVPSPTDPSIVCAKLAGHSGDHAAHLGVGPGPVWRGPASVKAGEAFKAAGGHKGKGTDPHPPVGKPGKPLPKSGAELQAQLHEIYPDIPSADHPGLPHTHPLSLYLGNPIKVIDAKVYALPEYSKCVPPWEIIKNRKWRCNRAYQHSADGQPADWWQGEYIDFEGHRGIRWSKLLWKADRKETAPLPPPDPTKAPPPPPPSEETPPTPAEVAKINASFNVENGVVTPSKEALTQDLQARIDAAVKAAKEAIGTQIPAIPAPTPPPPKPAVPAGKTLQCKICKHDISHHGPTGCTFGSNTQTHCTCKQVPPPELLALRANVATT